MKKVTLLSIVLPIIFSCSSDDEEEITTPKKLELSTTSVSVPYGGTVIVNVDADGNKVTVESDDEFIADGFEYGGELSVYGNHVGKTELTLRLDDLERKCSVVVEPTKGDCLGNPVLDFGIAPKVIWDMVATSETLNPSIHLDDSYINVFEGYNSSGNYFYNQILHTYVFENDKLVYVRSTPTIREAREHSVNGYLSCLVERYKYTSEENRLFWFEYPSKLVVRMSILSYEYNVDDISYAPNKTIMDKYSQMSFK